MLEQIIEALKSQGMTDTDARALAESSLGEAGARHAKADRERLDQIIKLLIIVRDGDESQQARARKALAARAAGEEPEDDPSGEEPKGKEADPPVEPVAEALSVDQVREKVGQALNGGLNNYSIWQKDLFMDSASAGSVVYHSNDKLWRRTFTVAADGSVALGDNPEQVEQQYVPITLSESAALQGSALLEAVEPDGSVVDVLLIAAGTSQNGRRYRAEVLKEAVEKFDGAKSFAAAGPDHNPAERGVRSLVGWYSNPRYVTGIPVKGGGTVDGVAAHFNILESAEWLRATVRDAFRRGKPDLIGYSIVGDGPTKALKETLGGRSRLVRDVQRIDSIESVDPVIHPAAGGRALRLVASKEDPSMDWSALTLAEAVAGIATVKFTPDELKEHRSDLFDKISAGQLVEATPAPAPAPAPDPQSPDVQALVEAAMAPYQTASLVEAKLADRKGLPAKTADRIRAATKGKALTEAEVDGVIASETEYVASINPAAVKDAGQPTTSDMKNERERVTEGLYQILAGKSNDSIRAIYVSLTGDVNGTGKLQEGGRLTESIVSGTFAEIMGDSITRRMQDVYAESGLDSFKQWVNIVPLRDFRSQKRVRMGGYGNLPTVAQGQPYLPLTTPGDEEASYSIAKKGGTEDLTLEAIANDDLGAMRDIPRRLGRAAAQTLHEYVYDFLANNSAVSYDSTALAHADHSNIGAVALGSASLVAGRNAMKKQTDMSNAKRLGILPKFLIVPIDLEQTAFELTATDREVASANNTLNFVRQFGLSVIIVDYWTDANNWWLVADKASAPTFELGFFNGQENPELLLQDAPGVGNVFSNDVLTWKLRHIYGGAVLDHRAFYGAVVA